MVSYLILLPNLHNNIMFNISYIRFPFNALTLLIGQQEGHQTCTKVGVGVLHVL